MSASSEISVGRTNVPGLARTKRPERRSKAEANRPDRKADFFMSLLIADFERSDSFDRTKAASRRWTAKRRPSLFPGLLDCETRYPNEVENRFGPWHRTPVGRWSPTVVHFSGMSTEPSGHPLRSIFMVCWRSASGSRKALTVKRRYDQSSLGRSMSNVPVRAIEATPSFPG